MNKKVKKEDYSRNQELIAQFSNALGHPVRVYVLQLIAKEICCYHHDMIDRLPIANSTLSQHLTVLKKSGLICGESNPPKTRYCINKENWNLAKGLMIGFFD